MFSRPLRTVADVTGVSDTAIEFLTFFKQDNIVLSYSDILSSILTVPHFETILSLMARKITYEFERTAHTSQKGFQIF